jgi:glycosyltransferase involved in cell wall biosynthesis
VPIDFAVCNSRHTRDRLPRLYPGVPAEVVHCPVPPPAPAGEPRDAVRAKFATPAAAAVVVQVGRWEPHKGHLHLMRALGELRDLPGWACWQVGAPQRPYEVRYEQEVRAEAARQGVADRVQFLGWQPDLDAILAAADVYCQPNVRPEPLGITVVEALWAGLPVVATALGGVCETVTPDCGVLVPAGDAAALAAALRGLVTDPARRAALGAAGPRRAADVSAPEGRVAWLAEVLRRFAGGPAAKPSHPAPVSEARR